MPVFALRWLIEKIKIIAAPDMLKKRIAWLILTGNKLGTFFPFLAKIAHFGSFGVHLQQFFLTTKKLCRVRKRHITDV